MNPNLSIFASIDAVAATSRILELAVRLGLLGEELRDIPRFSLLDTSLSLYHGRPIIGDIHPAVPYLAPLILTVRATARDIVSRWISNDLPLDGTFVRTALQIARAWLMISCLGTHK